MIAHARIEHSTNSMSCLTIKSALENLARPQSRRMRMVTTLSEGSRLDVWSIGIRVVGCEEPYAGTWNEGIFELVIADV